MICRYCAKRHTKANGVTCGNSYCSEANYHDNMANNTRSKRKKSEHRDLQRVCEILATKWGNQ